MSKFEPKIIKVHISPVPTHWLDPIPEISVKFDNQNKYEYLYNYYPDEISFTTEELLGLTRKQAIQLYHKKDVAYIQS